MEEIFLSYARTFLTTLAVTVVLGVYSPATGQETIPLLVRTGESTIVQAPHLSRVAVGDGKIAGVVPIGDGQIIVNGKSAGRTTLLVWADHALRTYDVTVVEQSLGNLRRMIEGAIADSNVHVQQFDHSIVLDGSVANGESLIRLGDIVSRFEPVASAGKYTLINAVTVSRPLGPLQNELAADPATAGVRVDRDAKGNLIVSGGVNDRTTAERVLGRVRALAGPYLAIEGKVIDRIETATVSQISVKVYILEVDETALRQLGVSLQSAAFARDGTYTLGSPQFPVVESPLGGTGQPGIPGRGLNIGSFFRTITLAPTLNLIMTNGHARLLSSPDLVTMPGSQADFLVGGQIPIPYASGPQQIAIQYKDFGVKLQVTPTILGNGGVDTVIAPEVSDLDFQDGVMSQGFLIPALKTSRLSTHVVTKSGESIVMGGLLRRMEQRFVDKIPLLGDLPILGKLFRSTRYQNSQTDVVFVMTPQILTR
jgi:Flp pilus assembly secretin CpaC